MRKPSFCILLVTLGLVLCLNFPASATYMNLEANSQWSFLISGGTGTLTNIHNYAQLQSNSTNPVETVIPPGANGGPNVGASLSVNHSPNLLHQEANNTPATGAAQTHVTGQGPTATGFLQQMAYESMQWSFVPDTSATFAITATNTFAVAMVGDNSSGVGAYRVGQTYTYTAHLMDSRGGGVNVVRSGVKSYADQVAPGNVVAPWDTPQTGQGLLEMTSLPLSGGVTYWLIFSDETYQFMNTSSVPLPPSLLLLGSGLAGLIATRLRSRRRRN